jgi:hypothetical protein
MNLNNCAFVGLLGLIAMAGATASAATTPASVVKNAHGDSHARTLGKVDGNAVVLSRNGSKSFINVLKGNQVLLRTALPNEKGSQPQGVARAQRELTPRQALNIAVKKMAFGNQYGNIMRVGNRHVWVELFDGWGKARLVKVTRAPMKDGEVKIEEMRVPNGVYTGPVAEADSD